MEHECNWGCYVDKYGVDHHSLVPYPIPSWNGSKA